MKTIKDIFLSQHLLRSKAAESRMMSSSWQKGQMTKKTNKLQSNFHLLFFFIILCKTNKSI